VEICTVGSVRGESVGLAMVDLNQARSWKRRTQPRNTYSASASLLLGEMSGKSCQLNRVDTTPSSTLFDSACAGEPSVWLYSVKT
jgi:hypothetical protein